MANVNGEVVRAPEAASWSLSRGRSAWTTPELAQLLHVPEDQVRRRLHAPVRRGDWVSPAQGLWIAVAPEYRTWGAPPGIDIVDRLMAHLGVDYYVGWLSAATYYGATHQAVQVFQVAVSDDVRDRQVGRTRFQFHTRRGLHAVPVRNQPTHSGTARVSTLAATMLDVATDVIVAGGIDNAATVVIELAQHEDFAIADLISLGEHYPASTLRRIGWMLDRLASRRDLDSLREHVAHEPRTPSRLNPTRPLKGTLDERWNVVVNSEIEEES